MRLPNSGMSALVCTMVVAGAMVVVACSGNDAPANSSSSSSTSSSGSSGEGSSGSSSSPDSGSSGKTNTDAGSSGTSGTDGGGASKVPNGGKCTGDSSCASGVCFQGGTGGGGGGGTVTTDPVCTIRCTMPSQNDPVCANDPAFTGKCNGKSYCQVKSP